MNDMCIMIDAGGTAFKNGKTKYIGDGFSYGLYTKLGIFGDTHNLSPIKMGEAKVNPRNFDRLFKLIHAVGPDGRNKRVTKNIYKLKLTNTLTSIHKIIRDIKDIPQNAYIALPLISSSIFLGDKMKFDKYMAFYLKEVEDILVPLKIPIHLQLFNKKERDVFDKITK